GEGSARRRVVLPVDGLRRQRVYSVRDGAAVPIDGVGLRRRATDAGVIDVEIDANELSVVGGRGRDVDDCAEGSSVRRSSQVNHWSHFIIVVDAKSAALVQPNGL